MPRSIAFPGERGTTGAIVVQGQQLAIGPILVGVMSAREGELPDGGEGLRAKLRIVAPEETLIRVMTPGEELEIPGVGLLYLAELYPPGADLPGDADPIGRGVAVLGFAPDPGRADSTHEESAPSD